MAQAVAQGIAEGVGLIQGGQQDTAAVAGVGECGGAGQGCFSDTALADEQLDAGGGVRRAFGTAGGQPSTRFLSSLRAVSVMTFSALRLNMPIMGMFRSTVSS